MPLYSREQIDSANNADLVSYLSAMGRNVVPTGDESTYTLSDQRGISIKGNRWSWPEKNLRGRSIDYLTQIEGLTFPKAVHALIQEYPKPAREDAPRQVLPPHVSLLKLPEPSPNNLTAISYLTERRGISRELVENLIANKLLYQTEMSWDRQPDGTFIKKPDKPHVVFLGTDNEGLVQCASVRACRGPERYTACGSNLSYPFSMPVEESSMLWVFEDPIDCLSHATMYPEEHAHRITLNGVSQLPLSRFLDSHPDVKIVRLGLHADERGRKAVRSISRFLPQPVEILDSPPQYGVDFNQDLVLSRDIQLSEPFTHTMGPVPQEPALSI